MRTPLIGKLPRFYTYAQQWANITILWQWQPYTPYLYSYGSRSHLSRFVCGWFFFCSCSFVSTTHMHAHIDIIHECALLAETSQNKVQRMRRVRQKEFNTWTKINTQLRSTIESVVRLVSCRWTSAQCGPNTSHIQIHIQAWRIAFKDLWQA